MPPAPYARPGPHRREPRGEVSLAAFGDAWQFLKTNPGPWVLPSLIFALFQEAENLVYRHFLPGHLHHWGMLSDRRVVVPFALILVAEVPGAVILGASLRMALGQLRRGYADLATYFSVIDVIPALVASHLASQAVINFGWNVSIFLIPAYYIYLGWTMSLLLIVDRGLSAREALGLSWSTMKGKRIPMFALSLVLLMMNVLGHLSLEVSLLVTAPLSVLTLAVVYSDLFDPRTTPPPQPDFFTSPIASPGV